MAQRPAPGTVLSTQKDDPRVQPGDVVSTDPNDPRLNIAPLINFLGRPMEKETAKTIVDIGIPTITSTVGAMLGARRGPPGAYAGSGVGGAVGEGLAMATYPALGIPLPPASEAATRMAIGGAAGTGGELASQGVFKLGGRVLRGASRKLDDTGKWVAEQMRESVPEGSTRAAIRAGLTAIPLPQTRWAARTFFPTTAPLITPAQASQTSLATVGENMLESSFFGSGNVAKIKKAQDAKVTGRVRALEGALVEDETLGRLLSMDVRDELERVAPATIRMDPATVGQAIQRGLSMNKEAWFKFAGKQFDKARELGLPDVPLDSFKSFASKLLQSTFSPEAMGGLHPTLQRLARAGDQALDPRLEQFAGDPAMLKIVARQLGLDATPLPATLDAESAADLASHLKAIIREDPRNEKMRGAAEQLLARLEAEMDRVGQELAPEARHYYNLGRDLWRGGHEQFRTKFLETVAEQYPSELGKQILSKPPEVIAEVLRAIPKGERGVLEQATLASIFERGPSTKAVENIVKEYGEGRLRLLLGPDARAILAKHQRSLIQADTDRLLKMVDKDPSVLASKIRSKSIETLRRTQALISPQTRRALEQKTLQAILDGGDEGLASIGQVQERLKTLSPARLRLLVGDEAQQGLQEVVTLLKRLTTGDDSRGKVFMQLKQASGTMRLVQAATLGTIGWTGGMTPGSLLTAGAVVLGPAALSKIITSPAGRQWLVQGIKAPPGSKLATRAMAELTAFMAKEGLLGDQSPLTPDTQVRIGGGE